MAQLQEELTKRSLDTKWNPLKGKKELLERLQVRYMLYQDKLTIPLTDIATETACE